MQEEERVERGMAGVMLQGALKVSVMGGLRQMSVDGEAFIVKGVLVGVMVSCMEFGEGLGMVVSY